MVSVVRFLFVRRRLLLGGVVVACFLPASLALGSRLRARLPDPWNGNRHVVVITDEPGLPAGTPFLRLEPSLEVLGVVEGPAPATASIASSARVRVSLFPEADGLPREDSEIDLRVSTPDLLEVVSRHFTPERRERLARNVAKWKADHEAAIDRALARFQAISERELGADELGRKLAADPALRDALAKAFEREVVDPIDWESVVGRALRSDAAGSTLELLEHSGPIGATWSGLREVFRARWNRQSEATASDGRSLEDGGKKTLDALKQGDPDEALLEGTDFLGSLFGSIGRADFFHLVRDPEAWVVDHVLPNARDWEAFKGAAAKRTGENLSRALPQHKAQLRRDYLALGKELASETALGDHSLGFVKAVARDAALQDDLVKRYGPEAAARVERLVTAAYADPELAKDARAITDSALELLAGVLREVALDDAGKGPNPLLVALVRARLLGRADPVLVLAKAGSGLVVSEGQEFVSRRR
jgi:hypothetical protein